MNRTELFRHLHDRTCDAMREQFERVSAAGGTATVFKADVAARAELRKLGLALSRCEEDAVVDKFVAKFDAWMASRTNSETLPDDN